jgi:hypothetical protein
MTKMKMVGSAAAVVAMTLAFGACGSDNGLSPSDTPFQPSQSSFQSSGSPSQTASFGPEEGDSVVLPFRYTLTVSVGGSSRASGAVVITPPDVKVGMRDSETFAFIPGKRITLTAKSVNSKFGGWDGPCRYQGPVCKIKMSSDLAVHAYFFR